MPTMNLSADQEKLVKMSAQALAEWWAGLGMVAWVVLGMLLMLGILLALVTLRFIKRGGLRREFWPFQSRTTFHEPEHPTHCRR